jgi:myo-inositol-1(or 4)-monophosphatase
MSTHAELIERITAALDAARDVLSRFQCGEVAFSNKGSAGPVTEADGLVDAALRRILQDDESGWLSEESADDADRLGRQRVWVVDPIDGTREFVDGISEWCVSIGLVENGNPIAGGICNPATGEVFVGSLESGMMYNGVPVRASAGTQLKGAAVLASRTEVRRGQWEQFRDAPFTVCPVGSVAYKLALVAAGRADATWTLINKHEWDVAAGVALVRSAGGFAESTDGATLRFNSARPKISGLIAGGPSLRREIFEYLGPFLHCGQMAVSR